MLGDADVLEVLRQRQAHFGRQAGAMAAPSPTPAALRRIVRDKAPIEGAAGEERARLRHKALTMLSTEVNSSLDDETYREMLPE